MQFESYIIPRENIHYVTAETSLRMAYDLLEDYHYRALPVLSDDRMLFRGNIYRSHVHQALLSGQDGSERITSLLKNATKHIYTDSSFYHIFFAISDLPYIAVLEPDKTFAGILTHGAFERMTYRAWCINASSYIITVAVPQEKKGMLAKVTQIISRYASMNNTLTMNHFEDPSKCLLSFSLDASCSYRDLDNIIRQLERRQIEILYIEEASQLL